MTKPDEFDLRNFMPYLLAMAAEAASSEFRPCYKARYGMLLTEWRVLFHIGRYGAMTAREICDRARIHKTKVSRAVAALEAKQFIGRYRKHEDRRQEELRLTKAGQAAFRDLCGAAKRFDEKMMGDFSAAERKVLIHCLTRIAERRAGARL